MKNFDESRKHDHVPVEDRTFVIGGEVFVAKEDVHPSVLTAFDRLEDANVETTLAVIDETILSMVEPTDNAAERYRAVRARTDDPIKLDVMVELARWLVEMQTGRPTGQPSASAPGPTRTGAVSTVGSYSPVTPQASVA